MTGGVQLGSAFGEIQIGTGDAEASVASLSRTLRSSGTALSVGITAPLALIGATAVSSAADFEQSLNVMQQVTGATDAQMQSLQGQALQLGADTVFGAGEAAEAMLELAKAGMTAEEVGASITGVMDLAAAGGIGLADAATITANALNAFNLEAGEAANVANTLAAAANASSADVNDLALGFQMASAVFAANGQEVDDLSASLAILANNGMAGSDAGTSLKQMMMRLAAPTDKALGVINNLGVAVYDATGTMRPFGDIIMSLENATAGLSDEQRNAAFTTIFGSDAIRAANILVGEGVLEYDRMKEAVNQAGAAQEVAGARMGGFNGAVEKVKGSIDSLLIGSVLPWLDSMSGVATKISEAIDWFGALPQPVKDTAMAFMLALASIGPIMLAITGVGAVISALLSPISLLVGGVVLLGTLWATNFGGIRDQTMAVWAAVQPTLTQWWAWLQVTLPQALTTLQGIVSTVWTTVSSAIATAWAVVFPVLTQLWTWAQTTLPGAWTALQTNITGVWTSITGAFSSAQVSIGTSVGGIQGILTRLQTAWQTISTIFGPAIERIRLAFSGLPASFAPIQPALQGLLGAFQSLWQAVQPILQALGQLLAGVLGVTALALLNAFSAALRALGPVATTVVNQITLVINTIATVIRNLVVAIQAIAKGDWTAAWTALQTAFQAVWDLITGTIGNLTSIVTTVLGAVVEAITSTLTDLGVDIEPLLNTVKTTWDNIWGGFTGVIDTVNGAITSVQDGIQGFIDWITGIEIPNPFAGLASSLDNIRQGLPSWVPGSTQGSGLPGNAEGTNLFPGGMHLVGERGPELVVSPPGSRVMTAGQTQRAMSGNEAQSPRVYLTEKGDVHVGSDMDIHQIAYKAAGLIQQFAR